MQTWNGRDTLPKDGTRVRILWSNGKEDVGYFDRLQYGTPWVEGVTKVELPEIYAEGGEWSSDYGEGDNCEFHPVGWLPLAAASQGIRLNKQEPPMIVLEQDEAQFILDLLGNLVVGHPSFTMRRMSDAIIVKLKSAGHTYNEDFCSSLKEVNDIHFIK